MTLLAGDLGGTKTLLSLCSADGEPRVTRRYDSRAFDGLLPMVQAFLAEVADEVRVQGAPRRAVFGVAGPITEVTGVTGLGGGAQKAEITNLSYAIETAPLAEGLGLEAVRLVNDFYAVASAVAAAASGIGALELVALNPEARAERTGAVAVLGAGTGMGQALIARSVEPPVILPTEGGHSDFAPRSELEADLLRFLLRRFPDHVSVERVLCGAGLVLLYEFFRERGERPEQPAVRAEIEANGTDAPAVISRHGLARSDGLCDLALDRFVQLYGAEAGNLALKSLATGGVYLAGGIAARILPRLTDGVFLRHFAQKGRFSGLLAEIPVFVVKDPAAGLRGAARLAAGL
jgi:glucokinase